VITLENRDTFCLVGVACVVVMGNQPTISLCTVLQRVFYGVGFSVLLVFNGCCLGELRMCYVVGGMVM
jgi:hypothetical protein